MSLRSVPFLTSSVISMMPELSSLIPISASLQHIPFDVKPARALGVIVISPILAPTFAKAVLRPTFTFGAPQTTSISSSSPASILRR